MSAMKKTVLCEKAAWWGLVRGSTLGWVREGLTREVTCESRTEWLTRKSQLQEDLGSGLRKASFSLRQEHIWHVQGKKG